MLGLQSVKKPSYKICRFFKSAALSCLLATSINAAAAPTCTTLCVISPTGNDANAGDVLNPLLTIQAGVNQVAANGTVQVNAGAYSEAVLVTKDNLTIAGAGSGLVTLTAPVLNTGVGIFFSGIRANVHVSGLTVRQFQFGIRFGSAADNQTNVSARNLVSSNNGEAGLVFQSTGTLINATISNVVANNNGAVGGLRRGLWLGYKVNRTILIEGSTFNNNSLVGLDINDGVARDVIVRNNTVVGNTDSGIAIIAPIGPEATLIANNTVTDNGRFGIEIKNPAGNGAASGAGSIVVRGNVVSRTIAVPYNDGRDSAGIMVFRRAPVIVDGQPAQPSGVWVERNTVTGYKRTSGAITAPPPVSGVADGFGIVVEGTNHTVVFNIVSDNNIGIQLQSANPDSTSARATAQVPHFDRGDAASLSATVNNNAICLNTDFGLRKYEGVAGVGATVINAANNWWRNISGFNPPGTGDNYSASGNALGAGNGSLTVAPFMVSSTDTFLTGNTICPVPITPASQMPPTANDDFFNMNPNGVGLINVLANDSDPNGDVLTITSVSAPLNGTVVVLSSGQLRYIPNANYAGQEILTYIISDGNGGTASANVVIRITNRSPIAVADMASTFVNALVTIAVLTNDTEPDSQPLTVQSATAPAHGTVLINANGTLQYKPVGGYAGTDIFSYTINDGVGGVSIATVTITITNRVPIAVNDAASTFVNTAVAIPVLNNDSDPDGSPLAVSSATLPAHGTVIINANGTISYTPTAGYVGADSFSYVISDGSGGTATATVTITVGNRNPIAVNDVASTVLNTAVVIAVLANDSDPDAQALAISSVSMPVHGTAVINANGTATYTPTAGYLGADSFTYSISDGGGGTATATVTIAVGNRNPVAVNDIANTLLNTPVVIAVLANDSDPDAQPLTVTSVSVPAHGTVVINVNGTISYTPTTAYIGLDSFSYTISDGAGGTATALVTVTISTGNRNPVAANDVATTRINTAITIPVLVNDSDPDAQPLTVTSVSMPAHGTVVINANGTVTYTPTIGYLGADSFTYTISDGAGGTATATVSIVVTASGVVINPDVATTTVNVATIINVLANDVFPTGVTPVVVILIPPSRGAATVSANGTISYVPNNNAVGADSITYAVMVGGVQVGTATVSLSIVNQAPIARTTTLTIDALNVRVPLALAATDPDVGGTVVRYEIRTLPLCAQLLLGETPMVVGSTIPAAQLAALTVIATCAADTGFSYIAVDNLGLASAPARINLNIAPAATAPEPQQVPTLGEWALLLLIALFCIAARKEFNRIA